MDKPATAPGASVHGGWPRFNILLTRHILPVAWKSKDDGGVWAARWHVRYAFATATSSCRTETRLGAKGGRHKQSTAVCRLQQEQKKKNSEVEKT